VKPAPHTRLLIGSWKAQRRLGHPRLRADPHVQGAGGLRQPVVYQPSSISLPSILIETIAGCDRPGEAIVMICTLDTK
jgi:hypothetical protein